MIPLRLVVVLAVLRAGTALAASGGVERIDVPGGPSVLLARRPGQVATLVVRFDTGSVDDGGSAGLTLVAQHALLSANASLDYVKFGTALLASGGSLRLETGLRSCAFILTADRRDFPELAQRLIKGLLSPRVDVRLFRGARQRALHDGQRFVGRSGPLELIVSTAVNDPRYKNPPYGDPDQIELVTDEAVTALLAGPFSPANATVVLAGAFDREPLLARLRPLRGGRRIAPEAPPLELPVRSGWRYPSELHIVAWPVRLRDARDAAVARVLVELVDRTLWDRFREAGATYGFSVEVARSPWLDLFVAALPVRNSSGVDAAGNMLAAVKHVRDGSFDAAGFERARAVALGKLAREDEEVPVVAAALADGSSPWLGEETAAALRALDRKALLDTAAEWLGAGSLIGLHFSPREGR